MNQAAKKHLAPKAAARSRKQLVNDLVGEVIEGLRARLARRDELRLRIKARQEKLYWTGLTKSIFRRPSSARSARRDLLEFGDNPQRERTPPLRYSRTDSTRSRDVNLPRAEVRPVFSHDIFAVQRVGGISRYVCELHNALCQAGTLSTVIAPLHVCGLLAGAERVLGIHVPELLQIRGADRITRAVDHLTEPAARALVAGHGRGVVVHPTYYSSVPPSRKYATAITVYDMIHERYPEMFSPGDKTSEQKRLWCERADAVIAISDYTKHQLVRLLDIDPGRVTVCHLGVTRVDPEPATRNRLATSRPFFLYVGNRGGHKNFDRLVRAFSRSRAALDGTGLIAFGGGKPTPTELRWLDEHRVSHLVSFARGDDASLAAHYATARGLLYPSLDEGFGMPPLEAMLHGCPVAAADAGAIPEVVADAALLFDPTVVESMTAAIDRIASDRALGASLASRGASRAPLFTWDRAARTTLSAYAAALEIAEARS